MTDTKQITFEGREYTVPVWVEWVAMDENGDVWGYSKKPDMYEQSFDLIGAIGGRMTFRMVYKSDNWRDSLTKV
jgi:hypothetical protein